MFSRNKQQNKTTGAVRTSIAKNIAQVQQRCAGVMHRRTKHWNKQEKIIFLVITCLVFLGTNTFILIGVFTGQDNPGREFSPGSMPSLILPHHREQHDNNGFSTSDTMAIYEFRKAIDSLQRSPEGRKAYEDFLRERPGFMDSLQYMEQRMKQSFYQ